MKKLLSAVLGILFLVSCSVPQTEKKSSALAEASPESQGMSSERLARIDNMLNEAVSDGTIPGAVALVARNGKIVYHKAFGMADNESGRLMKKDDIFRIASQTKAVTATAVMMLWEEGRFRLDDPISKYIPEFKNPGVLKTFNEKDSSYTTEPAASEITIRQLLTHTSGVGYGFIDGDDRFKMIYHKAGINDAFTEKKVILAENIKKLGPLPLHHNPGEKYVYSEGLDVLGYLIEIVSGMPFDQFLRTRLFDPLGMDDTWFYLPEEKASRLVSVQEPKDGTWKRFPVTSYDPDYPVKGAKSYFAGGAGLTSTVKDYATMLQMYLNGGELNGKRILSRTTVQAIMGNQNYRVWGEDAESYYGLAFGVLTKRGAEKGGLGSEGTFNWGGYFNTSYFADPVEKTIGLIFKQTQNQKGDGTEWKFRLLVGQAVND
ncbi:MAG TPA: serine hydrolase domain-containing protein [Bacteroidales bacterium]|nr:serine hydrolase domain-containing protein [Bacteroidales bacterium]